MGDCTGGHSAVGPFMGQISPKSKKIKTAQPEGVLLFSGAKYRKTTKHPLAEQLQKINRCGM
jgi:hypothetical protein